MTLKYFSWRGYGWVVSSYKGGPGSNTYSTDNAFIKDDGLHLKVSKSGGIWKCAELGSTIKLGYGTYRCVIQGKLNSLDPNIVLSMFNYGKVDYINEIDIEISKWGNNKSTLPLGYTVYPATPGPKSVKLFPMVLKSDLSTHRFTWTPSGVNFLSQQGVKGMNDLSEPIASFSTSISLNIEMPICFDMWLMGGHAPKIGAEVVIKDFEYKKM